MANKYLDNTGLAYFWSKIKAYVNNAVKVTGVKGNSESSYRTGNVNITAANVGAIPADISGNTQKLSRPSYMQGASDNTIDAKINTLRANRLAFLPADQIIIEKTTDGGVTWVDAGIPDSIKVGLFSETRAGVNLPLLNGVKSLKCGMRITITAMKYDVPSGTAETEKYNYWNSNHVLSTERYNQLKEMYFWVSVNSDTVGVKVERATGANPNNWSVVFNDSNFLMTGWSGNDYLKFSQSVFGGGTSQTTNYWNYRITFMTKGTTASNGATLATSYTTSSQAIMEIRAYGDTWWNKGNEYAANDKIYTHDYLQNVTFPAKVYATEFAGKMGASNITGTIAIDHGGTGKTTANDAANALLSGLPTWTANPTDDVYLFRQDTAGASVFGRVKFSTVWNYIKGKISSVLGLTETSYNGSAAKVNNHTVNSDVPANAKFTDTVTTVTTSGSGNAVTAVSASNGALTVTKGTTFLTSHQDISGKQDKLVSGTNIKTVNNQSLLGSGNITISGGGSGGIMHIVDGTESGSFRTDNAKADGEQPYDGSSSDVYTLKAVAIGSASEAHDINSISIGNVNRSKGGSIAIGGFNRTNSSATNKSIAIGVSNIITKANGDAVNASAALGAENEIRANGGYAIGISNVSTFVGGWLFGNCLKTGRNFQYILGRFNEINADNLLIVGSGTAETDRKNAAMLSDNGTLWLNDNIELDMSDYQTANTTDKALYDAIVALGWDGDVLIS